MLLRKSEVWDSTVLFIYWPVDSLYPSCLLFNVCLCITIGGLALIPVSLLFLALCSTQQRGVSTPDPTYSQAHPLWDVSIALCLGPTHLPQESAKRPFTWWRILTTSTDTASCCSFSCHLHECEWSLIWIELPVTAIHMAWAPMWSWCALIQAKLVTTSEWLQVGVNGSADLLVCVCVCVCMYVCMYVCMVDSVSWCCYCCCAHLW